MCSCVGGGRRLARVSHTKTSMGNPFVGRQVRKWKPHEHLSEVALWSRKARCHLNLVVFKSCNLSYNLIIDVSGVYYSVCQITYNVFLSHEETMVSGCLRIVFLSIGFASF